MAHTESCTNKSDQEIEEREERIWRASEQIESRPQPEIESDIGRTEWQGHDMSFKTSETGIRIATLNTQRKFFADDTNREVVVNLMEELRIDIMVITEAGKSDEMKIAALKNWAIQNSMSAEVVSRAHKSIAGGIIILTSNQLIGLNRKVHTYGPKKGDKDRAIAIEFDNGTAGDHNKMMVIGYYGYNMSHMMRAEVLDLHEWIWKVKSRFKKGNWKAPVVLLGDMNAAVSSRYDTDREDAEEDQREPDAMTIDHIESMGFHDPLRQDYPSERLTTRKTAQDPKPTMRYLDRILMSSELSTHSGTRVGIFQKATFGVDDTDHKLVVADLPVDIAATATIRAKLWDTHERTVLKWDSDENGNMNEEKRKEYNEKAKMEPPESAGPEGVTQWLQKSGKGSVLKEVTQEYPRKVRKLKDFQATDWTMRQNAKILREAARLIDEGIQPKEALNRTSKLKEVQDSPHLGIKERYVWRETESRNKLIQRIWSELDSTTEYLNRENRKHRAAQIRNNIERRNRRFDDPNKKSLKAVITSIMRRARVNEQIVTQTRGEGRGVATEAPEVAREVIKFYSEWMRSRVPWDMRWKSWEGMMSLNTDELKDKEHAQFIEEAYADSYIKYGIMQEEEGIWNKVWEEITMEDLKAALKKFKSGRAGGPSGVTYDLLKALDEENLGPILELMRRCLKDRELPKELNRSMIRALAKTEQGMADLNLTRPIALMEALGKLFERILFMRIVKVLSTHNMIDLSQHGGMAHRSTADPIRILAEVMEDAEESGQEFHLFSADLSKAFDSLEFWSQAMSWRALGMPEDMTVMLMNLDQMAESEVILGQGRTTSVVLGEEGWFKSGRGVRQGSIGGPIKWIVYMNFWLKYVDKKRADEGYSMSADETATLRSQMFVDDSNWATRSVEGMNKMIESGDTFVGFHGLTFNKKKSEYIVMNQKLNSDGEWERPKWPDGQELIETIRVSGSMEPRRTARMDEVVRRANRVLYRTTYKIDQETVKKKPTEYWRQLQKEIVTEAEAWKTENEERWWKSEKRDMEANKLVRAVMNARGECDQNKREENLEIEAEAREIVKEWTNLQVEAQRLVIRQGTAMRYLGVWFEAGGKWMRQRSMLEQKFRDSNERISRSCPTREQAVYCINATINAALKFPLQVANVPRSMLEEWDRRNRDIVRKAGYLPKATPPELIHLPRNEGGLGLESLRKAVSRVQIGRYMKMLNTDNKSLTARIVRAGRSRIRNKGNRGPSIHERTIEDIRERGMEITEAFEEEDGKWEHRFDWFGKQIEEDKVRAKDIQKTGGVWEAYGDGATYSDEDRSGWGLWMRNGNREKEDKGRIEGEQSNDGSEAMAILRALLEVNPEDNIRIYCDNSSCVSKWNKLKEEGVNMVDWSFRATWNRIQGVLAMRKEAGSETAMKWVHSHVSDESRRTSTKSNMTCACRETGETECNPSHRHHIGNDRADTMAKAGAQMQGGKNWGAAAKGELWFVLRDEDGIAQGNYKTWLKQREVAAAVKWEVDEEDTGELPKWAQAVRASDRKVMLSVLRKLDKKGSVSWRFWSRALCQSLPTHERMMKFANSSQDNDYKKVYGGHVGLKGKCVTCGEESETVEHALRGCPAVEKIWDEADLDLEYMWENAGADWKQMSWMKRNNEWEGWSPTWGLAGLIPLEARKRIRGATDMDEIAVFTLVRNTAMRVLQAANVAWKWRVEATQRWEKENEVMSAKKTEMKKTRWARGAEKPKKIRKITEEMELKRKRTEYMEKCKENAREKVRTRIEAIDDERNRKGYVPMSAQRAEEMAERAVNWEVSMTRNKIKKAGNLARIAKGSRELEAVHEDIEDTQRKAPRLTDTPVQSGQNGLWFPGEGERVKMMEKVNKGEKERYTRGRVTGWRWEEGGLPKIRVEYEDNRVIWHDVVTELGTKVRMDETCDAVTLVRVPYPVMETLGHGTEILITWINNKKNTTWFKGRIVAIDPLKGWAVRYDKDLVTTVAWHTDDDMSTRGLVVTTAKRIGEHTNESYQEMNQNMKLGCLLLTDEGECECKSCKEVGWPMEFENEADEQIKDNEVLEMGPRGGRAELIRRTKERKEMEEKEHARERRGRKTRCHQELDKKQLKKKKAGSESFVAGNQNCYTENGDCSADTEQPGQKTPDEQGEPKQAHRRTPQLGSNEPPRRGIRDVSHPGTAEADLRCVGTEEERGAEDSIDGDRNTPQRGNNDPNGEDQGREKVPRNRKEGDKEQSSRGADRAGRSSKGMGMGGESYEREGNTPEGSRRRKNSRARREEGIQHTSRKELGARGTSEGNSGSGDDDEGRKAGKRTKRTTPKGVQMKKRKPGDTESHEQRKKRRKDEQPNRTTRKETERPSERGGEKGWREEGEEELEVTGKEAKENRASPVKRPRKGEG